MSRSPSASSVHSRVGKLADKFAAWNGDSVGERLLTAHGKLSKTTLAGFLGDASPAQATVLVRKLLDKRGLDVESDDTLNWTTFLDDVMGYNTPVDDDASTTWTQACLRAVFGVQSDAGGEGTRATRKDDTPSKKRTRDQRSASPVATAPATGDVSAQLDAFARNSSSGTGGGDTNSTPRSPSPSSSADTPSSAVRAEAPPAVAAQHADVAVSPSGQDVMVEVMLDGVRVLVPRNAIVKPQVVDPSPPALAREAEEPAPARRASPAEAAVPPSAPAAPPTASEAAAVS
jgi:hypothetical protein